MPGDVIPLPRLAVPADKLLIDRPRRRPFGLPVTAAGVRAVWDEFVVPSQEADEVQSNEVHTLIAILRSVYAALEPDDEPLAVAA